MLLMQNLDQLGSMMKGEDNDWAPLREDSEPKDKKNYRF